MAFTQISGNGLKNNSITNAHLHSGANIAASKLADSGVTAGSYGSASLIPAITVNAQGLVTSVSTNSFTTTDNNFTDTLLSKLNGIEASATADQTNAEIKTAYEANSDTNAFTDALLTKLNGIAASANNYSFPYTISTSAGNGTVVRRVDPGGYIYASYFNTTPNDIATGSITKICAESGNDGFIRHATAAAVRSFLNVADGANNVTNYVTNNASDTLTGGTYTFSNSESQKIILSGATNPYIRFQEGTTNKAYIQWNSSGYFQMVNQESGEYLRIGSGNNGLQFVVDGTARNVIHSNNVQSYALRTVGGSLSGSLTIGDGTNQARLLLQKADNNVSDHIIFYNGTTRIGEIGCEDNSWLRINQETAKNIFTPRLFRSDGGFQVGSGTDIQFTNGTNWSGNHCKIQHHSNYLYIVGGSNGFVFREGGTNRFLIDGSGHFVPGASNTYDIGASGTMVRDIYCSTVYLGQSTRYLSNVTGQYGSVQINGSGVNGYEGYSIDGRYVLMHNGSNDGGLYNDVDNEWYLYTQRNGTTIMYFNGSQKFRTESYGGRFAGTFRPDVNNARDLGASDARWATFYVVNQPNVSDRNEKNTIQNSDLGLDFINKLRAVSFKWNDANLGTKTRYGLIVQEVEDAVKELGKNPDDLGMIDKPEFGSMGLCVNELVAPFVKAIQELSAKVAALEAA